MRISKCSILLIILFTFLSAYVSRIVELITVDYEILAKRSENNDISGPFPDDTLRHVIWFLQVSDLHISQFIDPNRIQQFREFCKTTVRSIKPHIVLATGDLTDAKTGDFQGSRQFIEEWRIYAQILTNSGVLGQTTWLDIRGNHDNFNVPSINSTVNYYSSFSVQGKLHPRSYLYQFNLDNDSYHFIGVDACLDPGPRRPFNFVGILKEEDMSILKQFEESSRKANATIWFGHYPTASILSPYPGIRYLMRNAYVYLCGHFHTLGGLVPNMYTLQQTGNLELELADWKESRMYRMAAIDHGLFSFVDTPYNSWPVILITNPKNALYNIPSVEPLKRILQSTHVRILVFSVSKVNKVEVQINNGKWQEAFQSKGPLYVVPWQPHKYITGIHTIRVKAQDSEANEQEVSQSFSLDGSQLSFRLLPRILLMSNMISLNQALFGFFLVLSIVPLCIIRILHKLVLLRKIPKPRLKWRCGQVWIKKFWVLISIDRLFYPLLLCALYVPIGPWFIGEILEDHIGICFAFGTFVGNTFLPGGITFAFGSMHLLTFQIPLTICLAHSVDYRYQQLYNEIRVSFGKYLCHHIPFLLLLTFNLWIAYTFFLAYGILAFVLGPLKTWTIILCLYLWHQIVTLPEYYFDQVRTIFPPQRSTEEHIPLNTNS